MSALPIVDYLDLTLSTPAENLALDEALLLQAEAGKAGEVLRFWELSEYAVILGAGCAYQRDVKENACQADGVPILRRCSGGGTVLLGPGCLCFSLVLSKEQLHLRDVRRSYEYIFDRILTVLPSDAAFAGSSDLMMDGRKFSGNSQRRLKKFLLHHGTILYDFDLERIERYLNRPERQPAYRRRRGHTDFVCNLPFAASEIRTMLVSAWQAETPRWEWPTSLVTRLLCDKYSKADWTLRR